MDIARSGFHTANNFGKAITKNTAIKAMNRRVSCNPEFLELRACCTSAVCNVFLWSAIKRSRWRAIMEKLHARVRLPNNEEPNKDISSEGSAFIIEVCARYGEDTLFCKTPQWIRWLGWLGLLDLLHWIIRSQIWLINGVKDHVENPRVFKYAPVFSTIFTLFLRQIWLRMTWSSRYRFFSLWRPRNTYLCH